MLPLLVSEIVNKRGWATESEILDYYSIGQLTPGIIAVNTATFVGHKKKGFFGALVATIGLIIPSLVIIIVIANFLSQFNDNIYVQKAFRGIRISVCALIIVSIVKLAKKALIDIRTICVAFLSFIFTNFVFNSPVMVVFSMIVYALLLYFSGKRVK